MSGTVIVDTKRLLEEEPRSVLLEEQELARECAREEEIRQAAIHQAEESGGWVSVRDAAVIMGRHFVGLNQIIERFDLGLLPSQVRGLEFVRYPEDLLWKLRDSYLLIAGVPVAMMEVRQAACRKLKAKIGDFSYDSQPFATRKMEARWYLVSREIARGSLYHTMAEHDARIFNDPMRERLGAPELAYVAMVARLVVGEPMLKDVAAFTSDSVLATVKGPDGKERQEEWPVFVGFSGEFGVGVGTCPGNRPIPNIGAVVSVRPCDKK